MTEFAGTTGSLGGFTTDQPNPGLPGVDPGPQSLPQPGAASLPDHPQEPEIPHVPEPPVVPTPGDPDAAPAPGGPGVPDGPGSPGTPPGPSPVPDVPLVPGVEPLAP